MSDEFTKIGTIISCVEKETSNNKLFKKIAIMPEGENEVIETNAFDNRVNLDLIKEGNSFNFTLEKNGLYTNLNKIDQVPDGKEVTLTDEQKKKATSTHYDNISKSKNYVNKVNSIYSKLSEIQCEIKKKGNFNYVPWVVAWDTVKKLYPTANFNVYENTEGKPYFEALNGLFVKIGVTINTQEHICWYPVLDNYNKEIPKDKITVFDINKSIQRGLTKAIALHGLGIYVFKGEDLPDDQ